MVGDARTRLGAALDKIPAAGAGVTEFRAREVRAVSDRPYCGRGAGWSGAAA